MVKVTITIEDRPRSQATGAQALAMQAVEIIAAINREVRDTTPVIAAKNGIEA